ncbi:UBA-like_superfamily [Hexamita inflata]|uniref:UBA-like superfamily n=1 Tax=Hexamita inflata TaxID=28002 RepID=A0AA86VQ36_9EUKA|nr:UBA-like superfamily [Hexamita inflata]
MTTEQLIKQFNDVTNGTVEQATRFLTQNNNDVQVAIVAFLDSGEEPGNAPVVVKPEPHELLIQQMMETTNTSREQAIRFLQNNYNKVGEAVNNFIDSGEEPRGNPKEQTKPVKEIYNKNQNNYNYHDNVEDTIDYYKGETSQSQKSQHKQQPVQKENKQVKSFFNGANNQVRFQENMNVSFDIANKYISAANGDYDKAVKQYQEDQMKSEQTQKNNKKSKQKVLQQLQQNNDDNDNIFKPVSKPKKQRHQQNSNGYNQNAQYGQNQQFNYQAYPQQDQMQYDPNMGHNQHYNAYPYDNQYYQNIDQNVYGQNQQPPQLVNQGPFYGQGQPPLQSDQLFGQQFGSVPPQPQFDQGQFQNPQMFNAPFQQQLQNGQYLQNDQQFNQVPVNFNQNNMQNGFQVQEHTPAPPPIPFNSQNQVQPNIQLTTTNFPQNGPNQFEQVQGINFGAQNNQGFNQPFNQPQVNFQQQNPFNSAQPNVSNSSNTQQFTPVQNTANQQFAVGQTESNQFVNQNNAHTGQFNANETKFLPFVSSAPFNQLNAQTVQQNPAKQLTPPVLNQQFIGENQAFSQGQNQQFQANGQPGQFTQTFLNNPANQFTDNNQQQNLQGSQQPTPPFIQSRSVSQQPFVNQFENNQAPTQFNGSNQVNFTSRTTNFPQIDQTQTSQPFSGVQSAFNAQNQQPTNLFAQNANPVVNLFGQNQQVQPAQQQAQPNQFEFKPEQTPAPEFKPQTGVNFGQPAKPGQIGEIIKAKESALFNSQGNNQLNQNQFAQGNTINLTKFENPTQAPNSQPTLQANQFNPQGNGQQFNPNQFQGNTFGSAAQSQNFQPNLFNSNGNQVQGNNFNAFESKQVPNNLNQFVQSPFDPTKQNQFAQFNQIGQNQGVNFGQNQNGFDPKLNGNTFNSQQFQQK